MKLNHNLKLRFLKYIIQHSNNCWIWNGCKGLRKKVYYGQFNTGKKIEYAHRVSYKLFKGKIPKNLTIDHQCNDTLCVNPNHLKLMTLKENILRGNSLPAINARKTHCIRGHELISKNLAKNGKYRCCKICYYASHKRSVLRNHEKKKLYWRKYSIERYKKLKEKRFTERET